MARRSKRIEESFQMAPMIDMVFLLLVFFMTVSTIAKDARPELELATSSSAHVPDAAPPRDIISIIREKDQFGYYWSNRKVDLKALSERLAGSHGREVVVRAGAELPWEVSNEVLQICRTAGVTDIIFATFED